VATRGSWHARRLGAFDSIYSESAATAVTVVVGSGGVAMERTVEGRWLVESTGTDQDLYGIVSFVKRTEPRGGTQVVRRSQNGVWPIVDYSIVVGSSGTILERSEDAVWKCVESGTTTDLRVAHACGADRVYALGDDGTGVQCVRANGQFSCEPWARPLGASRDRRVRSEPTKRDDLSRLAVNHDGTVTLYSNGEVYRPGKGAVKGE
jgi:hypothetical protein